jgi:hypothetical protein
MQAAQAKEQVDALQRDNGRLSQLLSEVKGQLANAKVYIVTRHFAYSLSLLLLTR